MMIVFRTDASIQIGTGHVIRCLTLADALKEQGAECHFICRGHPGHLLNLIQERGHRVHTLLLTTQASNHQKATLAHADWLGTTQQEDANLCISLLNDLNPDWLVVDHYALDADWEKSLRPYCKKILVVDDLADREHECDLLLDQTFGRESKDYKPLVPEHSQILCGSQYALLRPEFAQWRDYSLQRRKEGKLKQLLINLGGVDKDNITTALLQALQTSSLPKDCNITVVMGSSAPWIEAVKQEAKQLPWETEVKTGVNNMAELMANSDLAIGAAGATSWERCCLGLPTLMLVLAENQEMIARKLEVAQACQVIDHKDLVSGLTKALKRLTAKQLHNLAAKASDITDGRGAERVLGWVRHKND
ncbi:UDP-2,4-diacetamido-2,4,6-trideoxy-beta-L-altropyranose hydrolase [Marinospirillum sp.]|uniref:UDP-2,4-diacetamido-2,4, 6-trideoxy-beta-L-altropyranose hydrolase n=1 Tax=Marinospirillum sp. TaxID=2183934 RepID=UPI00384B0E14